MGMKNIIRALAVFMTFLILAGPADARRRGGSRSHGSGCGHYKGGRGSSHKGGSYRRKSTNNHYRHRK